jgi:hypothetical protein
MSLGETIKIRQELSATSINVSLLKEVTDESLINEYSNSVWKILVYLHRYFKFKTSLAALITDLVDNEFEVFQLKGSEIKNELFPIVSYKGMMFYRHSHIPDENGNNILLIKLKKVNNTFE